MEISVLVLRTYINGSSFEYAKRIVSQRFHVSPNAVLAIWKNNKWAAFRTLKAERYEGREPERKFMPWPESTAVRIKTLLKNDNDALWEALAEGRDLSVALNKEKREKEERLRAFRLRNRD